MRFLIGFLVLVFSVTVFAENWMSEKNILEFKNGKDSPKLTYAKRGSCESIEKTICFEFSGKDLRRHKIGYKAIDIEKTMNCESETHCYDKIEKRTFICDGGLAVFDLKVNWPDLDFVDEEGYFLWCKVKALVFDSEGDAKAKQEDAKKESDKETRKNAKGTRETELQKCVQDSKNETLTLKQTRNCINALVKEILGSRLEVEDL
jgi:hypothetical protein